MNVFLEKCRSGRMKISSKSAQFFHQCYFMSSFCSCNGSFHPCRTSADNQYPLRRIRWHKFFLLKLLALHRIYCTLYHFQLSGCTKTLITSQTRRNILRHSFQCLFRNIWICHQCTSKFYQICLTRSNNFFHLSRIIQRSYTSYWFWNVFFNLCCQIYIYSSWKKWAWMGPTKHFRIFMISTRNIKQTYFILYHLGHFNIIWKGQSPLLKVISIHT